MSDIRCQNCDEPWDAHHLRYDAIHETTLPEDVCRQWDGQLLPRIRRELESVGYRFGSALYSLKACPCCPKGAKPEPTGHRRGILADLAADLLGDDLDGLLAELSDFSE